ncbi:uncharacterized protein LOC123689292 [Pieris rapae]|uniref:uncharacterized protein LOC123689292 n=1 Tax=Pieris rapae TaxID=64459 RepID=UPI001E27C405|nr:uncharacterized protein LOC123689292 [Pieris rapae]
MCLNVEIVLPTVKKFLLLYPLKIGCILTYFLTMVRSVFCVLFFMTALLELVVGKPFPIRPIFVDIEITAYYTMYFSFVILLLTEFVLMVFTIHLGVGSFTGDLCCLKQYLICRIITWVSEVVFLPVVCFTNKPLIGWYLGIMFFVVIEFYFFIIVYSYYYTLAEDKEFEEGSYKIRD